MCDYEPFLESTSADFLVFVQKTWKTQLTSNFFMRVKGLPLTRQSSRWNQMILIHFLIDFTSFIILFIFLYRSPYLLCTHSLCHQLHFFLNKRRPCRNCCNFVYKLTLLKLLTFLVPLACISDILNLGASTAVSEFCVWVQIWIDVYIPHRKYKVKPHLSPWFSAACTPAATHRNHFRL